MVGALSVDAYAYRDDRGHRLLLYLSDRPFPVAAGAHRSQQPEGPWVASDSGVETSDISGDCCRLRNWRSYSRYPREPFTTGGTVATGRHRSEWGGTSASIRWTLPGGWPGGKLRR